MHSIKIIQYYSCFYYRKNSTISQHCNNIVSIFCAVWATAKVPTQIYSWLSSLDYNQKQTPLTVESWSLSANSTVAERMRERSQLLVYSSNHPIAASAHGSAPQQLNLLNATITYLWKATCWISSKRHIETLLTLT